MTIINTSDRITKHVEIVHVYRERLRIINIIIAPGF